MNQRHFGLLAVVAIFVAYTVTIQLALGLGLVGSLLGGLANTIPVVIFGVAVQRIVVRRLMGRPVRAQLAAHLLLCTGFILLSYGLLIVLLGVFYGSGPGGFMVRPLSTSGAAWQSLQNLTIYAFIAAVSYIQGLKAFTSRYALGEAALDVGNIAPVSINATSDNLDEVVPSDAASEAASAPVPQQNLETRTDAGLSRYFVKIGEELRPLDIDTVVCIAGAGDYAEMTTLTGKHLVRVTLAEFASSLDPARYVRVHRSWIVNTHRIAKAESAGGGRLLLHLETGQTISTSRDGARLLRHRVL